ncbi:MAG: hypothetical protein IKT56_00380 [Clostridia bacterium]|nr:hypothetical protein [Clostridia bacterium]
MKKRFQPSKDIKFYNVLFPLWMLLMFPQMWLIVLPGNFIIDSLVLLISMIALKFADKKACYKKYILKIYCIGLLSDFIGALYMFLMVAVFEIGHMGDELYITLPALMISAILIFSLNYFITFRKNNKNHRIILSLVFAIVTAPYTFLVPSAWLYG